MIVSYQYRTQYKQSIIIGWDPKFNKNRINYDAIKNLVYDSDAYKYYDHSLPYYLVFTNSNDIKYIPKSMNKLLHLKICV